MERSKELDPALPPSPPEASPLRTWRGLGPLLQAVLAGLAYYGAEKAASALAPFSAHDLVPFWPAAGVLYTALLLTSRRRWPGLLAGVAVASLAFNVPAHGLWLSVGFAIANLAGPLVAAPVVRRFCGGTPDIDRVRDTVALMAGGALLGPAISATLGAATFALGPDVAVPSAWLTWMLSNAVGGVTVAPLVFGWTLSRLRPTTRRMWLEALAFMVAAAVTTLVTFSLTDAPMLWAALVVSALAGLRLGVAGASAAVLPWVAISVVATAHGEGGFAASADSLGSAVLLVQASAGLGASVTSALGAVAAQLRIAVARLHDSEERVRLMVDGVRDHAMFMLDGDGRIDSWNAGAERMLGFPAHVVIGRPAAALCSEAGSLVDLTSDGAEQETWMRCADGSTFLGRISAHPIRQVHGDSAWSVVVRDVTEARHAETRLRHMALHDELTGLPNRTLLQDRLRAALINARREGHQVAVLFCDLDRFKVVNDSLGHEAGDEVLRLVAARLEAAVRPGDTVARFGGDEFVFCLETVRGPEEAIRVAARIERQLDEPLLVGEELFLRPSIGIAIEGGDATVDDLLRGADAALFRAKQRGGGHALVDQGDRDRALGRLRGETAIRRALARSELELYYQPVMHMPTGKAVAVEALLRWNHPTRGLLAPAEFIRLAEDTGAIVDIGLWAIEEACRAGHRLREVTASPDLQMNVNVSARQIAEPGFVEAVGTILGRTATNPVSLCLELTETTLIEDLPTNQAALGGLKRLGVRVAMDDFGTGYSSLAYLRRLPIDVLKLDRSFVAELDDPAGSAPVLQAAVGIAQALSIELVAEGIEQPEQAAVLRGMGYKHAQGYLFARPLAEDEIATRLGAAQRPRKGERRLRVVGGGLA